MNNNSSLSHRDIEPEEGVLYIVGTPIGNLNDLSSRAINILENVDLIACEDTRQTKKIMSKFKIRNSMISFNKFNSLKKTPNILENLTKGKSIALVSDAGMPNICDPGEELVKKARINHIDTVCIPGPCAAIVALVASGFPASKFVFEGFLPKKKSDREKILIEISENQNTTILYESPHRINRLLEELKEFCGGSREIQIARELTKKFEEIIGPDIDSVISMFRTKEIIGEFTIIVKGKTKAENELFNKIKVKKDLHELVELGLSVPAASKYLAKKLNLSKNLIYDLY
jgi:16S rRNA (cytidine1402-2'-O)-methyltransferase